MEKKGTIVSGVFLALLAIISFIAAAVLLFLFYRIIISFILFLLPFIAGIILVIVAFLFLWVVIYAILGTLVTIYVFFAHPMRVEERGEYTIDAIEENGKRKRSASKNSS
ncbi:MAG: hypothetical protein GWO20_04980 [Candidatus Korarchaeota archaeon]|nr:hypothetical protein [Candidatus Korarchaeota archaeon]NIU82791.1 hypothetical protein [Candidatus Thorarchaeota archaeon]NIW13284.1 hypothetical protein [Candidatus Thorarchaeota archaeon]NIW52140.1 hypothetical protein [Candidatus Korarchaeota archaeon]